MVVLFRSTISVFWKIYPAWPGAWSSYLTSPHSSYGTGSNVLVKLMQSLYGPPNEWLTEASSCTDVNDYHILHLGDVWSRFSRPPPPAATNEPWLGTIWKLTYLVTGQRSTFEHPTRAGTSYVIVDNGTGQPRVRSGYPRQLSVDWPSLRGVDRLDAAVYIDATSDDTAHLYLFRVSICLRML